MKNLVIIPVYNEERNIANLVKEISALSYDYIVINDCSNDNSHKVLNDNNINHLDLATNAGIANVTQYGFKYAVDNNYDNAIVVDGDGQHPPKYIKVIFDKLNEGYDYVVGSRYVEEKKPWSLRMIGSRIISFFIFIKTGKHIKDPTSGMRGVGKNIIKDFANGMNYIAEPDALTHIIRKKYKYCEVQVEMEEREKGVSYFAKPIASFNYMVKVIVSIVFIQ